MKTLGIPLITLRYVSPNSVITSYEADVLKLSGVGLFINYCQTDVTGDQAVSPNFIIEGQCAGYWSTLHTWQPIQKAPSVREITSSAHTGTTTLNFSTTPSDWGLGSYFLRHEFVSNPTNVTRSEFVTVVGKTATTVELVDPTEYMHPASASQKAYLYNLADSWAMQFDTTSYTKIRLVIDAGLSDKTFVISANGSKLDET